MIFDVCLRLGDIRSWKSPQRLEQRSRQGRLLWGWPDSQIGKQRTCPTLNSNGLKYYC
jgi:hypothetical protein